jgi:acetyl-CoA C-acetyltransferase
MGQTAENLAFRFGISRAEMDAFAARATSACSPRSATAASHAKWCRCSTRRQRIRGRRRRARGFDAAEPREARPFFDRKYGNVTAGNSSQVTDGAAWLLLATDDAVRASD